MIQLPMNTPLSHWINAWESLTVLVIGDAMLDCYWRGTSDRLCQEAPVPVVAVTQRQEFPGGAANVAANVANLGAATLLLSVVGNDEAGDRLRDLLRHQGVSHKTLLANSMRTTLLKQRVMADSHLLVRFDSGTTDSLPPKLEKQVIDQLRTVFPDCDAVIISDYGYGVLTPRIIQVLAELHHQYQRTLIVDAKQLQAYRLVAPTAVKPNYRETLELLNLPKQRQHRAEQIAPHRDRLLEQTGANLVAVTLDTEGALWMQRDRPTMLTPASPAPMHQTSGAGDTFVSALGLALASGAPIEASATLTAAATAVAVTQIGTTQLNRQDLKQALLENQTMSSNLNPTYV
jgi:D-beta-D-heptose 7-phosphate kinase / D-beta-D-heptose 1-phosphate adenosyltransferase